MTDSKSLEHKKMLSKLATEYQSHGYEVEFNAMLPQLPMNLQKFRPDLVARRGDETVILEVKSYIEMSNDKQLGQLAKTINEIPGWRFEVVILKPKKEQPGTNPELLRVSDINNRTLIASKLIDRNEFDLALLIIWTNVEALLRHVVNTEGIQLENQSTEYILKNLLSNGLLTQKDYQLLSEVVIYRNKLVHGYKILHLKKSQLNIIHKGVGGLLRALERRIKYTERKPKRALSTIRGK